MYGYLVVYYSRSGATRAAAEAIAQALPADVEEIVETRRRAGIRGYLRSSVDASLGRLTHIAPRLHDPSVYDLVVVGSPVWNASVSSPVRTYLSKHRGQFQNVAFFCTEGYLGGGRAFRQMAEACAKEPVAVLELTADQVHERTHLPLVKRFAERLREATGAATASPSVAHGNPNFGGVMPIRNLKLYLERNRVKYVTIGHSPAYTAQEIAASAHVPGKELAKTVMVKVDGKMAMAVLPASLHVDFDLLKEAAHASRAELASEQEFANLFPECEIGAMPPFGNLYGMDVYVADVLAEDEDIVFNAGTHTELIKLAYRDFEGLVHPKVLHFSTQGVA